ncbi:YHYH protein [Neptunomonas antarctica]|uniref:YHYH protein n=1 Tax=Neptunomonas antarctica TaxID=619304 RepID=A0A1N7NLL7_9GAMM|nr:YHYH protein [Neptunomonas antarctica]SIS99187.1 YHYH protein [Neptunomonas antarctica]
MKTHLRLLSILGLSLLAYACSNTPATTAAAVGMLDPSLFAEGAIVGDVEIVDCTLSGGTKTTCYRITIAGAPADPDTSPEGPYCPPSIESGVAEGGTWIDGKGTVYEVDGKFIKNLATLYKDKEWQMYDIKTGKVTIITGARGCEVAGDPRPIPGFKNFCLECPLENIGGGIKKTVLIPTTPVPAATPTEIRGRDNTGVALNGVLLGPPAPLEMILSSHSLGVFDDCGAHANPHEGYHYHAATGCSEIGIQKDGHSAMIGYALDGYALYAKTDKSTIEAIGLDECGGETDEVRGYHYHPSAPGKNQIFGCYRGERGYFEGENKPH